MEENISANHFIEESEKMTKQFNEFIRKHHKNVLGVQYTNINGIPTLRLCLKISNIENNDINQDVETYV